MTKQKLKKKVGLALGSGGARGFCHIGVLQVLEENNIKIDCITGCSMGALVGACYAVGIGFEQMIEASCNITQVKILDIDLMLRKAGILKGNKAMKHVRKLLGDKTFDDCKIPFAATCVDACKGELIKITEGKLIDSVRASISMPAAFQKAEIGELDSLIDGGVMERIPIPLAKSLGADVVIAVDALGPPEDDVKINNVIGMIERAYQLMDWESTKIKMKEADLIITPYQPGRQIHLFKNNLESIQWGREATEKMLPEIIKLTEDY